MSTKIDNGSLNISKPLKRAIVLMALVSGFFCHAKTIEKLTSGKTAKDIKDSIPQKTTFEHGINSHSIGIGIGQTFLTNDFDDNGDSRITPDLYYNYSASHSFDLLINFHYSTHKKSNKEVGLLGIAPALKAKLFSFDNFAPVVFGGFGFYQPTVKRIIQGSLKESEKKTVFGYHFGGGAELRLNKHFATGVLFHFHNPFDVKQDMDPEVEGSYYKLMLTGFYTF
ncbi:MAG: porin family protein [Bdellovibrionales bacterium]|nr:porin family protein [Bdellovibrionales bacterium]